MSGRLWLTIGLALALPGAAFVFVPQRAGVRAKWQAPAELLSPAGHLISDLDGNVIAYDATSLIGLAEADGAKLWSYTAPAGSTLAGAPMVGGDSLVVVTREGTGQAVTIASLHPTAMPREGGAVVRWSKAIDGVPANGVYLPRDRDPEIGDLGLLAVISGRSVLVLDLETGEQTAAREVGQITAPPLWVEDTGFFVTADGYRADGEEGGGPAVAAVDLAAIGTREDPSAGWIWRIPADETIERLEWLPNGAVLAAHGQSGLHILN